MNLCIKCEYLQNHPCHGYQCSYGAKPLVDPIRGYEYWLGLPQCRDMRHDENKCGAEGRWFKLMPWYRRMIRA